MNPYFCIRFAEEPPLTWWQRHGNKFKVAGFCLGTSVAWATVWVTIYTLCHFSPWASPCGALIGFPIGMGSFLWAEDRWPLF